MLQLWQGILDVLERVSFILFILFILWGLRGVLYGLERVWSVYRVDVCVREPFDFNFVFFDDLEVAVRVPAEEVIDDGVGNVQAAHISHNCRLIAVGDFGCFEDCVKHRSGGVWVVPFGLFLN